MSNKVYRVQTQIYTIFSSVTCPDFLRSRQCILVIGQFNFLKHTKLQKVNCNSGSFVKSVFSPQHYSFRIVRGHTRSVDKSVYRTLKLAWHNNC